MGGDLSGWAHPRSRGENLVHKTVTSLLQGSSPLTRGKRVFGASGPPDVGLIPAHAGKTDGWGLQPLGRGAHPRSRGENCLCLSVCATPRWLIPAHAGKTRTSPSRTCAGGAHPRSRGENMDECCFESENGGSSPLTRGKRVCLVPEPCVSGLIPAHAGKTALCRSTRQTSWAHPRSRGENSRSTRSSDSTQGSSPLTRGKLSGFRVRSEDGGLIPAHAGKTQTHSRAQ